MSKRKMMNALPDRAAWLRYGWFLPTCAVVTAALWWLASL